MGTREPAGSPGWLAKLIRLRDGQTCREPYCAASIRRLDHIIPFRDGGQTTQANGRGVCERHNHIREMPGWNVETIQFGPGGHPSVIATATPTGHTYLSRAPDPP